MSRRAPVALIAALAACSTMPPRVGEPPPHVPQASEEQAYRQVLDRWTRRAEIYDGLDTRLFAGATEESPDFRVAKAQRLGEFKSMPSPEVQALIAHELAAAQQSYDFFLGVHPNNRSWDDFDRPDSIWRLALETDNGEATPALVERVGRPDVNVRGVYTYLGDFWTAYRVHFPVTFADGRPVVAPGEKTVTLLISSAVGRTELVFPAAPVGALAPPRTTTAPVR